RLTCVAPVPPRCTRNVQSQLRAPMSSQITNFSSDCHRALRDLHSFPTRRSSDLPIRTSPRRNCWRKWPQRRNQCRALIPPLRPLDRKSTRLNSSHVKISYAVFCLKKKNSAQQDKDNELNILLHVLALRTEKASNS